MFVVSPRRAGVTAVAPALLAARRRRRRPAAPRPPPTSGAAAAALALAAIVGASGCSGDGPATCAGFAACGGDPVGRWTAEEVCPEEVPVAAGGCAGGTVDPSGLTVAGSYVFSADGTVAMDTVADGVVVTRCPLASGVSCADRPDPNVACAISGDACVCTVTIVRQRNQGTSGWQVVGDRLSIGGGGEAFARPFCVEGDALVIQTLGLGRLRFSR